MMGIDVYHSNSDDSAKDEFVAKDKLFEDKDLSTFCEALQHNLLFDSQFQIGNGTVHCPCGQFGSKWQKIFDLKFSVECKKEKIIAWDNLRQHCRFNNDDPFHKSISVFLQTLYPQKYETRKEDGMVF